MNISLIVEDEALLCDVYQKILKDLGNTGQIDFFETNVATNCHEALTFIEKCVEYKRNINFSILDYRMGGPENTKMTTGLSIGLKLKSFFPQCKILMITSLTNGYVLHSILKRLKPDGFLIKSDIDLPNLKRDIISVLNGQLVYSKKVKDFVRKSSEAFKSIDEEDLEMIHLLDKGLSLPEIGSEMGLSISGIEYRKRKLAENLGSTSSNINTLLEYVRKELKLI